MGMCFFFIERWKTRFAPKVKPLYKKKKKHLNKTENCVEAESHIYWDGTPNESSGGGGVLPNICRQVKPQMLPTLKMRMDYDILKKGKF